MFVFTISMNKNTGMSGLLIANSFSLFICTASTPHDNIELTGFQYDGLEGTHLLAESFSERFVNNARK